MKKYFLGFSALVLAIAFSAFTTKPTTTLVFKLKDRPVVDNLIQNQEEWVVGAGGFGACGAGTDLACTITVDATKTTYFHDDIDGTVLNTPQYASENSQDFFTIVDEQGTTISGQGAPNDGTYYRIASVTPSNTVVSLTTSDYAKANGAY